MLPIVPTAARAMALIAACLSPLSGCAEYVGINSHPQGAGAYVDGKYIGTTPAWTEIPRSEVGPGHTYKVETANCDPAEGMLPVAVAPGRIVGYIFTAGIAFLFRGPRYFPEIDVELQGGDCIGRRPFLASDTPAIQVIQVVGDGNSTVSKDGRDPTQKLEVQLETVRSLYRKKLISEDEYEAERKRIMQEFRRSAP